MKRSYLIKNLHCANCAAKIERDIRKLDGVTDANVNFMTSKLMLEASDEGFEQILEQAQNIAKKYEPKVVLTKA